MTRYAWETRPLGQLFEIGAGKSVTPQSRTGPNRFPFLRTANVLWGRLDLTTVDQMHFTPDEIREKALAPGDLLVCEGGEVGRAAIWDGSIPVCAFQNHIHRLRPRSADVVPEFYMLALQAGFTQLGVFEGAANRTTIPNLSRSRLAELMVPFAPSDVQRRIAGGMRIVREAIAAEERKLATLWELSDCLLYDVMTGRIPADDLDVTALQSQDPSASRGDGMRVEVSRLYDEDGDGDVRDLTSEERLAMMWQLTRDAWAFTKHPERAESRLQRHVVRTHRRER